MDKSPLSNNFRFQQGDTCIVKKWWDIEVSHFLWVMSVSRSSCHIVNNQKTNKHCLEMLHSDLNASPTLLFTTRLLKDILDQKIL